MQSYVRSKDWQLKYLIAEFTISDLKKQQFADIEMVAGAYLVASGVRQQFGLEIDKTRCIICPVSGNKWNSVIHRPF